MPMLEFRNEEFDRLVADAINKRPYNLIVFDVYGNVVHNENYPLGVDLADYAWNGEWDRFNLAHYFVVIDDRDDSTRATGKLMPLEELEGICPE